MLTSMSFGTCPPVNLIDLSRNNSFPVDPGYVVQYLRTQQVKTRQVKVNLQDVPGKTTLSIGWFKRKSTGKDVGCCFTEYVCLVLICPKSFHQAFSLKAIQWLHQHHSLQRPPSKSANRTNFIGSMTQSEDCSLQQVGICVFSPLQVTRKYQLHIPLSWIWKNCAQQDFDWKHERAWQTN